MSRHSEAARTLDTLVVCLLSGVLLLCFVDTFADRSYLFGAVAGLVTVVAIVLVVDYYDKGAGVLLLCALPAYVLIGASVGVRTTSAYVRVPTPETLSGTLSATIGAGNQLLTTIPPVDSVGDATLIPYAVVFLAAGSALWAALRTERPLLPVLPLIVGLAVAILLGTQQREWLQLQSAGFAGVVLWWTTRRGARSKRVVAGERGRVVRTVATVLLVGGIAAGVAVVLPHPDDDDPDRVVLRGRVGSGEDVTGVASPLTTFRTFTRQPGSTSGTNVHDRRLLRVSGLPEQVPLRFVTLDAYDGVEWRADNRTVSDASDDLFLRIGSEVVAPRSGRAVEVDVEVTPAYLSGWLPLPGQLTSVSFVYRDGRAQRVDVRYNPATTTAVVLGGLDVGDDFTLGAVVAPSGLTKGIQAYPTDGPLQPDGAFLDESLTPWRESGLSRLGQVRSLATYLRTNGRFSDGATPSERTYTPGHDEDRLGDDFFFAARMVGDEEQYAAFLALAANRLGVPARVVVGAEPRKSGWVEGGDVTAWVEVRVADGTWRTIKTDTFMSHRRPRRTDEPRQLPDSFLQTRPSEPDRPAEQVDRPTKPGEGEDDVDSEPAGGSSSDGGTPPWLPLLALVTWTVPLGKLARRRLRASLGSPSARVVAGWQEVLDLARDLGRPVPLGLNRVEQAERLDLDPGPARLAQHALFARDAPDATQATAFWREVRGQRRTLARQAGWPRRVWAFWSPASLVPDRLRRTPAAPAAPAARVRRPGARRAPSPARRTPDDFGPEPLR